VRNIVLMRPIKSMIEFKQIIGRGTRTFDGKDFFTIYDFVRPTSTSTIPSGTASPCRRRRPGRRTPGRRPKPAARTWGESVRIRRPPEVVVKLADGKERTIRYVAATTYWSHDGRPITAQEFMDQLFGDLGTLVATEDELRAHLERSGRREGFMQRLVGMGYDADRWMGTSDQRLRLRRDGRLILSNTMVRASGG
jgi:type I restriction enzyme, R subunit